MEIEFKKTVSLEEAVDAISSKAITNALKAYKNADKSGKNIGTTIRLSPEIDGFYRTLADELGISIQSALSIVLVGMIEAQITENS